MNSGPFVRQIRDANRSSPGVGEGSIHAYTFSHRDSIGRLTDIGLCSNEIFLLWLWDDALQLVAYVNTSLKEEGLASMDPLYNEYFFSHFVEEPEISGILDPKSASIPKVKSMRVLANNVFFRDKDPNLFPLHLVGSLGLVALGFSIEDPSIDNLAMRDYISSLIENITTDAPPACILALGEPMISEFMRATGLARRAMSGQLTKDDKWVLPNYKFRYESVKQYMINLIIAAEYLSRAYDKLQLAADPLSSPLAT